MTDCEARTGPSETRDDDGPLVMDLRPGEWFRLAGEDSHRFFQCTDAVEWMGRTRTPMVACNGVGLDSSLRIRRCGVRGDREAVVLAGRGLLDALAVVVENYQPSPLMVGGAA